MGTKNRSEVVTTGRIVKHPDPPDDDDRIHINNYEMVPKLPRVKITNKSKQAPTLSDFMENDESKKTGFKLKPIGREKAFAILKQYNRLVSNETTLAVKNLSSVKLPMPRKPPKTLPKPEVTPRKVPIFTEGLSSLSKTSKPSFMIPKGKVLRANLPNNIVVAHKKENFSFGVKMSQQKMSKEVDDSTKFKQLHNLGLDSLPIVNLEKYMKTQTKPTAGVKGIKPIVNVSKKSKPRRLDPIVSDSKIALETSRSYDITDNRKNPYRWKPHNSANSESKAKVVWIGKSNSSDFAESRTKLMKNIYPQYDFRSKQQEELSRFKVQNRDPSVYGVCSLAPIDVLGPSSKLSFAEPRRDQGNRKHRDDFLRIPNGHQTRSNGVQEYFESDSDSSLNTNWKNMIDNAMTYRSSSAESGTITPRGVPNPPPSYVSSNNEEEIPIILIEASKTMHQIQEERSSLMLESASNRHQALGADSREMPQSPVPTIIVDNTDRLGDDDSIKQRKPVSKKEKEVIHSNVLELKIDDKHLSVPRSFDTERRPPVKVDTTESSSQSLSQSSSDFVKPKPVNVGTENQKVNVTTLELVTANDKNTPSITMNNSDDETFGIVPKTNNSVKEKDDNEEPLKHITINNKTLQFISPLETQYNAKRQ